MSTHPGSGNPTWRDWPDATTPINAITLERIEIALDGIVAYPTAWSAFTLSNGWAARAGSYLPRARLVGPGRVEFVGVITKSAGGANGEQIGVLPAALRPSNETVMPLLESAGRTIGCRVTTAGAMHIYAAQATAATLTFCSVMVTDGPLA